MMNTIQTKKIDMADLERDLWQRDVHFETT